MRRFMFTPGALIVLLILLPMGHNLVLAEEISEENDCFVDLDGDGFNDNTYDFENNRFGNNDPKEDNTESKTEQPSVGYVSFDFGKNSNVFSSFSNSEKFGLLKFSTRALDNCRGESDSNFGGDLGGIGGSGQSGGCAGGACVAN